MKFRHQSARSKTGFAQLLLAVILGCGAALASAQTPPESVWRVILTSFLHAQGTQTQPILGAKDTKLAAAWAMAAENGSQNRVQLMSKETFAALGLDWAAFSAKTAAAASAELASLHPEWIRDRNQVIDCAILRSKSPGDDVTVAILAPDFLQRFAPVFGRKILLAIPDKHTVYLFPRLASKYQEYGDQVLSVYRKSEWPVSREVFELSATGLRAIGEYEEP